MLAPMPREEPNSTETTYLTGKRIGIGIAVGVGVGIRDRDRDRD